MGKSRDRANRSGSDPVNIGTSRLSVDSGNEKVTAQDGTTFKKIFAEEGQVGSGNNRVIFKRGSDGKAKFQSTTDGGGWTLIMTLKEGTSVFKYSSLYWDTAIVLRAGLQEPNALAASPENSKINIQLDHTSVRKKLNKKDILIVK